MAGTHFEDGHPTMVDVGEKPQTSRLATAEAVVRLPAAASARLVEGGPKGDALQVAELAGIMAAKRTPDLIPLAHPLPLSSVSVRGEADGDRVRFVATCKTTANTGVEMEALTAASVAALTLYDMLKGAAKGIEIESVRLLRKEGGRSGTWSRTPDR
ncbi:MAG TPA: cyclic pyranopterin monophosphate synthase MoaC [Trueperaceae bacterium]|nr:cyclic pyranopterin monophosphate synthase MoaC [Trueperaceae bacterium]